MQSKPNAFERFLESAIFASRWLLAPFFLGLIIAMAVLLLKFGKELWSLLLGVFGYVQNDAVISILTRVDTALIAVLLLIIVFSGYENFVSKLSIGDHEDRPAWMGKISFSDLKMKLIGAIVAISAVELLKAFLISVQLTGEQIGWKIAIHLTFVISGLLFAASDWISDSRKSP
jgi:uncharacterized protein (TIGR00645 family)